MDIYDAIKHLKHEAEVIKIVLDFANEGRQTLIGKREIETLRNRNNFLEGENSCLSQRVKELEAQLIQLEKKIHDLEEENFGLNRRLKDSDEKIQNLQNDLRTAKDIETALRQFMNEKFGVKIHEVIVAKEEKKNNG
jgi:predicted RNase H-like nuclease (RuvC/YqgF family)